MALNLGKLISDAAKGVTDFVDKASKDITSALDQNGDGKLDLADIQHASEKAQAEHAEAQRKAEAERAEAQRIAEAEQAEAQRKADYERLSPLFPGDFERAEFVMPKMICVAEIDKEHAQNPDCKDSIGFKTVLDDMSVITIYRNHIDSFGLSFYPELENGVYYVDPCDRDHYIALDDYFSFMKYQRVSELQRIAQSLGAKHFRVVYKEKVSSAQASSIDASVGVKAVPGKGGIGFDHDASNSSMQAFSVEAEMRFPGQAPVRPELRYLKREINIINLIEMRMNPVSPLQHQILSIEMINSSGIKVKDAVKIDAILKAMNISASGSVLSEAQNEARRVLEYEIEF